MHSELLFQFLEKLHGVKRRDAEIQIEIGIPIGILRKAGERGQQSPNVFFR